MAFQHPAPSLFFPRVCHTSRGGIGFYSDDGFGNLIPFHPDYARYYCYSRFSPLHAIFPCWS